MAPGAALVLSPLGSVAVVLDPDQVPSWVRSGLGWILDQATQALPWVGCGAIGRGPWVLDRWETGAIAAGLTSREDSAEGLHAAMCKAMRAGSTEQQRQLILSHPDLAGKLAAARQLTPESTDEQASAGLDHLSDAERARFTSLNEAYKARFGIPFIIAAKDNTKASILAAFEARLKNNTEQEYAAALAQIERIARIRLDLLLS